MIDLHAADIHAVIIVPPKPPGVSTWEFVKEQICIMGIGRFMVTGLSYLQQVIMIKSRFSDKSVELLARRNKIPVFSFKSVNEKSAVDLLKRIKPDIVLTQVPEIIKPHVLKTAKIGFVNKHASLLPKYRGKHPIFWALLNGEKMVGYTLHLMDENIDTGIVLIQRAIKVAKSDTVSSLYEEIFLKAGQDLSRLVSKIKKEGKIIPLKNLHVMGKKAKYYSNPTKKDIEKFKNMGFRHG